MNRTFLLLSGALFFGGLFVVHLYRETFIANETGGTPVPVLIAFIDIPIGTPIRDEWISFREIPASYVESRHITLDRRNEIVGLPLAQAVHEGESILTSDISPAANLGTTLSAAVPRGMRAVTLPTTRNSTHGGLLQPGDRVDVFLNVLEFANPAAGREVVVLENVLVLAYGQEVRRERSSSGETSTTVETSTNVTLQLSIDQAALLTHARGPGGELQLVLRNPNDTTESTTRIPDVLFPDMMDPTRRARFLRMAVRSLVPVLPEAVEPTGEEGAETATGAVAPGASPFPGIPPGVLPPGVTIPTPTR
jgi:pilus assembly protein CpaB